jgi:hypothetical protein
MSLAHLKMGTPREKREHERKDQNESQSLISIIDYLKSSP